MTPSAAKNDRAELLVLGHGPAAAAAAIRAAQLGIQIVLLGRPTNSDPRPGETLAPSAWPLLVRLGLSDLVTEHHLSSPGIVSAWESDEFFDQDFLFNPYGSGWHLDRVRFDQQLIQRAIELGVTVARCDRLCSVMRRPDSEYWSITAQIGGQWKTFRGSFVIDATGRSSWLSHRLGNNSPIKFDRLLGIVGFLECCFDEDSRTYLEAAEDGWWYFANLPGQRSVAAFMTDRDLEPGAIRFKRLWYQRLPQSRRGRFLSSFLARKQPVFRIAAAHSARLATFFGENWAAVGDAAASWDPLSSQGISTALESGVRAVEEWYEHHPNATNQPVELSGYADWLEQVWQDYVMSRQHFYGLVQRWPNSPFWQRRCRESTAGQFAVNGSESHKQRALWEIKTSEGK
jgi:flavin-dependent dehydrogenase